jgi:hypothetical protein
MGAHGAVEQRGFADVVVEAEALDVLALEELVLDELELEVLTEVEIEAELEVLVVDADELDGLDELLAVLLVKEPDELLWTRVPELDTLVNEDVLSEDVLSEPVRLDSTDVPPELVDRLVEDVGEGTSVLGVWRA